MLFDVFINDLDDGTECPLSKTVNYAKQGEDFCSEAVQEAGEKS